MDPRQRPVLRPLALASALALSGCDDDGPTYTRGDASVDRAATRPSPALVPLGGRYTDLTESLGALPFAIHPGVSPNTEPEGVVGLFADLDGDARDELIVTATRREEGAYANRRAHVWALDAASNTWRARGPIPGEGDLQVMAATDLDGDRRVDLVVAGGAATVAWGAAGGGFDPPSVIDDTPGMHRYTPGVLTFDDVDEDGWTDLVVGNQFCASDAPIVAVLFRVGPRAFSLRTDIFPTTPGSGSYAILAFHGAPDERYVVPLGFGCEAPSPTFLRRGAPGPDGYPRYTVADPMPEDTFYNLNSGRVRHISEFSPMGGAVTDLNGDGAPDLFVSLDPLHAFYLNVSGQRFTDITEQSEMSRVLLSEGPWQIPWGAAFLDIDRDMTPDLVVTHGNDHSRWFNPSEHRGPQQVTAHRGVGDGRFVDATALVGLGRGGQWRALTVGDPDGDGDADLLVGGQGEAPRLYRDDLVAAGHPIAFRLEGTTSGAAATGARVTVHAGGRVMRGWAGSTASPSVAPSPWVFLSTGASPQAERVEVDWPSGVRQVLRDVPAGRTHTLTEPELLRVTPEGRHAPANGAATVTVHVTPRGPDGEVREGEVTARVTAGACALRAPTRDGARWAVVAQAPTAPGSCVVEVSIDGQPARVRPRIWWD